VNGMLLKSLQVYVGPFFRRSLRQRDASNTYTNLYIKELKEGTTEEAVKEFFGAFGTIKSSCLKTDKKGRPFAFVSYETHEEALKAVEESHDKYIEALCTSEEAKLYCQRAQKKSERMEELRKKVSQMRARKMHEYSGSNLYVKNLDETVDEKGLKESFEKFGEITSVKIAMDDTATPPVTKGFGFVCFKDAEAANKAISEMNGHMLGTKPLYVNVAQRKEVRQATLEVQYAARYSRMAGGGPQGPPSGQPMGGYPMYNSPPSGFPGYPGGVPGYPYGPGPAGARVGMMGAPKWAQQGMPGMSPFPPQGPPMQMPGPQQMGMRPPNQQQPQRRPMQPGQGMAGARPMPGGRGGARVGAPGGAPQMGGVPGQMRQPRKQPDVVPVAAAAPAGDSPLTTTELAAMSPEQQKNALGERLFAAITAISPDHAAKITGMLLEMDVTETLNLLESPDVLQSKVSEALAVLQAHESDASKA